MNTNTTDRLSAEGIHSRLGAECADMDITVYDCVASTNALLRERAVKGAPEGTVVAARSQTGGRGRLGRSFYSPEGTGAYISLLLRPVMPAEQATDITTVAAVAVCEAVEQLTGKITGIKWVNDVLIGGRKVCGILTEAAFDAAGGLEYAVLGVGLNVYTPAGGFPEDIAAIAGSILDHRETGGSDRLTAAFLSAFWRRYSNGCDYIEDYRRRCIVPGRRVNVLRGGESTPALALGIDDRCHLLVRYDDGREESLSSGEISVRLRD